MIRYVLFGMFFSNFAFAQAVNQFAGCKEADFVLVEAEQIKVNFKGMGYTPKCLRVKVGTLVTLPATKGHPLLAAADFNGVENPFASNKEFDVDQERELTEVGSYGYFCIRHGNGTTGTGMAGLIQVIE